MELVELVPVADTALPVAIFGQHLRLGTGFSEADLQGDLLRDCLRAALAAIEGRTGKMLISRDFRLSLAYWRDPACVPLPLAPVTQVSAVTVQGPEGPVVEVVPGRWRLEQDPHRPKLRSRRVSLPAVPEGGQARITMKAGFGVWEAVPADLRQAVLMLAAQYYEFRHEGAGAVTAMPFGVATLIERWRAVRVLGGGR